MTNATTDIVNEAYPKLGEGIFLTRDVAEILHLPYSKVRNWILEYWDNQFGETYKYTFGDKGNKAINFYTLIEFYTFYQLRQKGLSAQQIKNAHLRISNELNTHYPFATSIRTDGKGIWYEYLDDLIKADGKLQIDAKKLIEPFLQKIDFGKNNHAERYFPLDKSKVVVVDPKHQFGQPTIMGRNIRTETIYKLFVAGEKKANICHLYDLSIRQVDDAISYYKRAS